MKALFSMVFITLLIVGCKQESGGPKEEVKIEIEMDIHTAVSTGNLEVVNQYIDAKKDLNKADAFTNSTPLITAITFNQQQIAKALIEAGTDLELKNTDGATALHAAAWFGRIEMVQMLIDANADKTATNNFGATPRESIIGSFEDVKPIYEMMQQQLGPLGLNLDLVEIEKARPVIAIMLQ